MLTSGHDASAGYIFAGEIDLGSIVRIAPDGSKSTFYHSAGFSPRGMAFDANGNLFVSDLDTKSILRITPSGVATTFATGFSQPQGLAFDPNGNLFVADLGTNNNAAIYELSPNGNRSTFETTIAPVDLAFDNAGNLFVTEGQPKTPVADRSVYKFTPSGVQSTFATGLVLPESLAFDTSGNLFVADFGYSSAIPPYKPFIYEYDSAGNRSTFASGIPGPRGLTFDSTGELYVTSILSLHSSELYSLTPTGQATVFASGFDNAAYLAFAVPEPSTLSLLAAALAVLRYRCRPPRMRAVM